MSQAEKIALIISLLAVCVTAWISYNIFEGIPHLEDEFAYVWQAKVIAGGELTVPSPPEHKSFLVPFVVDHEGQRFGKYPIGWPAVLSLGERLGLRWLVNPFLAGLAVWLVFRLGSKLLGEYTGVLAAFLTAASPFFLMNSGSLLSHSWGLVLSTFFAVTWLDTIEEKNSIPQWLPPVSAGLALGLLAVSRPFTAIGVAVPFGIHGVLLLFRGTPKLRLKVVGVGALTLLVGSLHFVWQYAATGDPFLNPYTLWWQYDRIGFGPGVGVTEHGHNLKTAWDNLKITLDAGYKDLFGWFNFSWLFLPFGLIALRKIQRTWTIISVAPALIILYMGYWIGAWVLGPRYYYEGLFSLSILTASGIFWLAGLPLPNGSVRPKGGEINRFRLVVVAVLVALLVGRNLFFYAPHRIGDMRGLYGTSRVQLEPFVNSGRGVSTPALVVVDTEEWRRYAGLLELSSPFLDSPWIFIWSRGTRTTAEVIEAFPERTVYYYYPEDPWIFYTAGH